MKFDRIALKITFFVFISGLILMSNVAMSQTPVVDSSERSSGYSSYEEGAGEYTAKPHLPDLA